MGLLGDMALAAFNNKMAAERESVARRENYVYNERAANAADARSRALYGDFQSPEAMLRQYREAGLSPSMMFGGSGAGGATPANGAQGDGSTGVSPTIFGANAQTGGLMNTLLQVAQLKNLEASANKTNAEANTLEGKNERGAAEISNIKAKTAETTANIGKIIEETKNAQLQQVWQEYNNSLAMLQVSEQASTLETRIDTFITQNKILKEQLRSARVKGNIDEATEKDAIRLMHENVNNVIADTFLKDAQKKYTDKGVEVSDKQIADLQNQIDTRSRQTDINDKEVEQMIREWEVKNGIISGDHASYGDVLQRNIWSEHTIDALVSIINALH